jgi:uncharacterized protein (DUF697 family)
MSTTTHLYVATKVNEANKIINNNVLWAVGMGFVPVPVLDVASVAAVQIKLLNELSKLYGIKFSQNRAKNLLASLIGSVGTTSVAGGTVASLVKFIPIVGSFSGAVTLGVIAGASTYAVGKVFTQHFESGGTFLDFNPEKTRAYFQEQFKEGQKVAADIKEASK